SLTWDRLGQWLRDWRSRGLRQIRGNIVIDPSLFAQAPANAPWVAGVGAVADQQPADVLYERSSLGPDRSAPDVIKPDLVAPGVDILAAGADISASAADFTRLTGTSMATPHVSGLAALLREIHPDWSPAEIRSALMLTAAAVRTQSGTPAGPFERGAGRIAARGAAMAGFVLDERADAYAAADPAQGGAPAGLNLPSLTDSGCVGGCTFTRTLRSTLGVPVTWDIATEGDGLSLTTEPAGQLTLGPGATATITISAEVTAAVTQPKTVTYGYGNVRFSARGGLAPTATMPVAIPLTSSTLPRAIAIQARGAQGSKHVPLRAIAISALSETSFGLSRLQPEALSLAEDPTPEDYNDFAAGGLYRQQLTLPAGNARFLVRIDRSTALSMKLIVYADRAGEGFGSLGSEDQIFCPDLMSSSSESCDIVAEDLRSGREQAVQVTILVQNVMGSSTARDSFRLLWGLVNTNPAERPGNLAISGPGAVPAGQPFDLSLAWSLPGAKEGDSYIGVLALGSSPAAPANLGSALLTLDLAPHKTSLPLVLR
ncbi:MAG: S8 family serine peptidase, partial [Chloroflexales bacterium]|nr:S8 family serine peptidase [Chloroflexales bacterium]